jgi:quercetin dioxygenase-like cupin family protein
VVTSHDLEWIPFPAVPGAHFMVLVADEELRQVVFKFKFDPGTDLPSHTHSCHAIAYTISGEWAYEGLELPTGAVAYEPVGSTHTPTSESGAELVVVLNSETDEFLVNHMADGSDLILDMAFFKALEGASPAEAEAAIGELAG